MEMLFKLPKSRLCLAMILVFTANNLRQSLLYNEYTGYLYGSSEDNRDASYLEWLLDQKHNLSYHEASNGTPPFYLKYKPCCGFGHHFLRMASAYHFAVLYQIPYLRPDGWLCGGGPIYDHLIGQGRMLPVIGSSQVLLPEGWPEVEQVTNRNESHKALIEFINEVPGYEFIHKGLGYQKDHFQNSINKHDPKLMERVSNLINEHNIYGKIETDFQFYKQLMTLFEVQHHERIQGILDETLFDKHTVFGLHLRTGNGETGQFKRQGRGVDNLDQWLWNIGEMLCDYSAINSYQFKDHPLMIYVGTDTGSTIPKLRSIMNSLSSSGKCTNIPVINAEQAHPEEGIGHSAANSYKKTDRSDCIESWISMFLDEYFFTRCNTVIAARYSSFTQAAPLSYMMQKFKDQSALNYTSPSAKNDKRGRHRRHLNYFCQVNSDGLRMDCYDNWGSYFLSKEPYSFGDPNATAPHYSREPKWPVKRKLDLFKLFQGSPIELKSPNNTHPSIE